MTLSAIIKPRVLVVLPSWLGDTAMATPALRLLREGLAGSVIVGLGRPGIDELLAGFDPLDDLITADARSITGPAKLASRLKPFRFDAALLLPNSFASAMTVRMAGIAVRLGYDRDGRGVLLTHALDAPRRALPHTGYAAISAVEYYLEATRCLLRVLRGQEWPLPTVEPALELGITPAQEALAAEVLAKGGVKPGERYALLNPGGNNPAKRWPVERFATVAHQLIADHGLAVVLNGSPGEASLIDAIVTAITLHDPEDGPRIAALSRYGGTIGSLKAIVKHASLVLTNDTGPRHLAAAFGTPCISLFGPTDHRWTTLPKPAGHAHGREVIIVADPTLPESELADDHPERCRVDRIGVSQVIAAVEQLLA